MTVTQSRNLQINFANPYIVVGQAVLLNKKHAGWKISASGTTLSNPQ